MVLKKLFGGGKRKAVTEQEYTIDDLIVLERYDEAVDKLQYKLKLTPNDLHAHLKLADVYIQLRQLSKALDEYVYVAEEYASDGFFDKGVALLSKVQKLFPTDDTLPLKIDAIKSLKKLERVREKAMDGLRRGMGSDEKAGTSALELESLWGKLSRSKVVQRLDGEQLQQLFSSMQLVHFRMGTNLAQKDSQLQELYLIVRGVVEAVAPSPGGLETQLRTFSSGDIIGDRALFKQQPWLTTYRAVEQTSVLRLDRQGLEKVLVGNADPRQLLEVLRDQEQDEAVARTLRKLWS